MSLFRFTPTFDFEVMDDICSHNLSIVFISVFCFEYLAL